MKEGFTFNYASLKFLRKAIFRNFGGGAEKSLITLFLSLKTGSC